MSIETADAAGRRLVAEIGSAYQPMRIGACFPWNADEYRTVAEAVASVYDLGAAHVVRKRKWIADGGGFEPHVVAYTVVLEAQDGTRYEGTGTRQAWPFATELTEVSRIREVAPRSCFGLFDCTTDG